MKSTRRVRVAFQGARGAFSEEAAMRLLGNDVELVPRRTFADLFLSAEVGVADLIIAPKENSLIGAIEPVAELLASASLDALDEIRMRIEHHLIGCPTATFADIATVASHPAALAQCKRFFAANPNLLRKEEWDTAGSVSQITATGDVTRAAIAGRYAAVTYGGKILRENIEDSPDNYTTFVLLAPHASPLLAKQ